MRHCMGKYLTNSNVCIILVTFNEILFTISIRDREYLPS